MVEMDLKNFADGTSIDHFKLKKVDTTEINDSLP